MFVMRINDMNSIENNNRQDKAFDEVLTIFKSSYTHVFIILHVSDSNKNVSSFISWYTFDGSIHT